MQLRHTLALGALVGSPVLAADLTVGIEVPRLNVAEYHRPYVATWIEAVDSRAVTNLAVWYDVKMKDNEGTQWLKDLRQWWRRIGRELQLPVDGVTSATRTPGEHTVTFDAAKSPLKDLPAGEYRVVVEAAREGHAAAVLAASIFHFGEIGIGEAKQAMADAGIPVRLDALKGAA